MASTSLSTPLPPIAFIGGGNMAAAILGGLLRQGAPAEGFLVVEPHGPQRERLHAELGIDALEQAGPALQRAAVVVWAVKPQVFAEAAAPCAPWVGGALQLSIMAGTRSDALVAAAGTERVVRAMPNTPALIGLGTAGLYARPAVTAEDRTLAEAVLAPTGALEWVAAEGDLDAVTALSGSGPAYVFFVLEAMVEAGRQMGLDPALAQRLAEKTFIGAATLAERSPEALSTLRERVTSKGGTTHAAITRLQADEVQEAFVKALRAARDRARELGR